MVKLTECLSGNMKKSNSAWRHKMCSTFRKYPFGVEKSIDYLLPVGA